ncbi:MAG: hypothetical protein RL701_3855 [Pseudomonadota bacterium]|jgi:hypothetical protein
MSAEFYIQFADAHWYSAHTAQLAQRVERLPTFSKRSGDEFWLRGTEPDDPQRWAFDVRLFLKPSPPVLLELSAHPPSIEHDLKAFLTWLRGETAIDVLDEDGEPSGW